MPNTSPPSRPEWLEKLQNESWQAEILLSSLILFSLFQVPAATERGRLWFKREFFEIGDIDTAMFLINSAVYWLITGFVLHLLLRGIWIGLVGLSYTFPKGIRPERLRYQARFQRTVEGLVSPSDRILVLEKYCSVIFAIAFLFFMCMLGLLLFFLTLGTLLIGLYIYFTGNFQLPWFVRLYAYTLSVMGLVYLFDFLSLGAIKRLRWLAPVYYPIYRFFNWFTLASFYRDIYYVLITNIRRWKIVTAIGVYACLSIAMIVLQFFSVYSRTWMSGLDYYYDRSGTTAYAGYYADLAQEFSQRAHIQSDIIRNEPIRLFVVQHATYEDSLQTYCHLPDDASAPQADSLTLACLRDYYRITIDDSLHTSVRWFFQTHPITDQKGVLTWLDVRQLASGPHLLTISLARQRPYTLAQIPFYKQ
ncbi:hypothetical protein SAMN05421823_101437 [Catalinimonas alkaloidigena]|uniref:Uncharacterized protein n=1 Tax=Catalinimonas alkaloidigena TaxID=1075417 RepID=A0A1G8XPV4_9BACT|nr:hypothetical protein [Catalinimonas alkaloidigena]SDJ92507.1 hypothetical protein SAMN05421823_101437 [Catalinimonas alkaloidigena]